MDVRIYIYGVSIADIRNFILTAAKELSLETPHANQFFIRNKTVEFVESIKDFICAEAKEVYLGKISDCTNSCDFLTEKTAILKWLEKHIKDDKDKECMEHLKDITFNQVFTRDEILEFVEAYNIKFGVRKFHGIYGKLDVISLIETHDCFVIKLIV